MRFDPRAILVLLLCCGGCLPFAAPPTRSSLSLGPSLRPVAAQTPDGVGGIDSEAWLSGRVGVAPLGIAGGDLIERPVDVVAGYVFDGPAKEWPTAELTHGGYGTVTFYPVANGDESGVGRVGIDATGEVMRKEDSGAVGGGASVGVELEAATLLSGAFAEGSSSGFVAGAGHGETGIAVRASVGMRQIGDETSWTALLGLGLRLPAVAGFGIFFPNP